MARPVLIDTDAGVDDALALILALRSPEIRVDTITTVAGNVAVRHCTRNVRTICDVLNLPTRPTIVQGSARPLNRPLVTAPEVHGSDGLGGVLHQPAPGDDPDGATEAFGAFAEAYGSSGTIIALGPLTNVARALQSNPRAMKRICGIISMGGAFRVAGNTGPVSEFNYFVDPEAANIVFGSGIALTIVPLDLTQQLILARTELLAACRTARHRLFISRITRNYFQYHLLMENFRGAYMHDPLAVAAAVFPNLIRCEPVDEVLIETRGRLTRGMTTAVQKPRGRVPERCRIARSFQSDQFLRLFLERVGQ